MRKTLLTTIAATTLYPSNVPFCHLVLRVRRRAASRARNRPSLLDPFSDSEEDEEDPSRSRDNSPVDLDTDPHRGDSSRSRDNSPIDLDTDPHRGDPSRARDNSPVDLDRVPHRGYPSNVPFRHLVLRVGRVAASRARNRPSLLHPFSDSEEDEEDPSRSRDNSPVDLDTDPHSGDASRARDNSSVDLDTDPHRGDPSRSRDNSPVDLDTDPHRRDPSRARDNSPVDLDRVPHRGDPSNVPFHHLVLRVGRVAASRARNRPSLLHPFSDSEEDEEDPSRSRDNSPVDTDTSLTKHTPCECTRFHSLFSSLSFTRVPLTQQRQAVRTTSVRISSVRSSFPPPGTSRSTPSLPSQMRRRSRGSTCTRSLLPGATRRLNTITAGSPQQAATGHWCLTPTIPSHWIAETVSSSLQYAASTPAVETPGTSGYTGSDEGEYAP